MTRMDLGCLVALVGCAGVFAGHAAHAQQAGISGQTSSCADGCVAEKRPVWEPIAGRVTDAATGKPIANALVTYSGRGDAVNRASGEALNPPSLHGEVRTGEDGSFTLPPLVPGSFEVRVSAPGYLSARQFLGEHVAGHRPAPLPPLPAGYCMARFGKPDCVAPARPDGNFALRPSMAEVKQMGAEAQAGFGLAADNPIQLPRFRAAAFSPDGQRLALLGMVPARSAEGGFSTSCMGWIYDRRGDRLESVAPPVPSKYCEELPPRMRWEDDAVVLAWSEYVPPDTATETMRWEGGSAGAATTERREGPPYPTSCDFKTRENETVLDCTDDGEYAVVEMEEDCRQCQREMVVSRERDWTAEIESPLSGYVFDRSGDRLVTFGKQGQDAYSVELKVVDLKGRRARTFTLPNFRDRPELLAEQLLGDGKLSVAYTAGGSCDPFSPGAPYDPPAGHGPPALLHRSLCIATLPADEGGADAASSR